jgi:hypothetical protein
MLGAIGSKILAFFGSIDSRILAFLGVSWRVQVEAPCLWGICVPPLPGFTHLEESHKLLFWIKVVRPLPFEWSSALTPAMHYPCHINILQTYMFITGQHLKWWCPCFRLTSPHNMVRYNHDLCWYKILWRGDTKVYLDHKMLMLLMEMTFFRKYGANMYKIAKLWIVYDNTINIK